MNKIDLINSYISKCDDIIKNQNVKELLPLQEEIISVFEPEVPTIGHNLENSQYANGKYHISSLLGNINDMKKIKAKLENYRINIEMSINERAEEIEKLRLKQSILTINNTNTNKADSAASSTLMVTITFDQVIKSINKLPEETLSSIEKQELAEKLTAIEVAMQEKDKKKLSSKIMNMLQFIIDKGITVGIALLPYLAEMSKHT